MKLKQKLTLSLAALAAFCQPAFAWDNLYLIGEGTPAGWSLDKAIEMKRDGDIFTTVCYLTNASDGRSFRVQPYRSFDGPYYGGSSKGYRLENNVEYRTGDAGSHGDNGYSVPANGFYLVTFNQSINSIKINRMGLICAVGTIEGHDWQPDGGSDTYLRNENDGSVYTGQIRVKQGEFKFNVDPGSSDPWGESHYLFREEKYRFFTNGDGDRKWTVGFAKSKDEQSDLEPGNYRMSVNAADRAVRFTRLPDKAILDSSGVGKDWSKNESTLSFTRSGDEMVCRNAFFYANSIFKPVIDGEFYGSDSWTGTTVPDNGSVYLRKIDSGADLSVATPGFRDVYLRPAAAGDGTLDIYVTAPHSVWYEGLCSLSTFEYGYTNQNLNWWSGGSVTAKVNGTTAATLADRKAGWYTALVTVDNAVPKFEMTFHDPYIYGEATGGVMLADSERGDKSYTRRNAWLLGGRTAHAKINDRSSAEVAVPATGFYDMTVSLDGNGNPVLTMSGAKDAYIKGVGTLQPDGARLATPLSWHDGAVAPVAMVDGKAAHDFGRQTAGWYVGTVTDDGNRNPVYTLASQTPVVRSDAGDITFATADAADGKFVKRGMWLYAGRTMTPQIGDRSGSAIKVTATGIYDVTIYLNDGAPALSLDGPYSVWYEGLCELGSFEYGYTNQNLNWWPGGTMTVKVNGVATATFADRKAGWYTAMVTAENGVPRYDLTFHDPHIYGEAAGNLVLTDGERGDGTYTRHGVWLLEGRTAHAMINDRRSADVKVPATGFYDMMVSVGEDGNPLLTLGSSKDAYIAGVGTLRADGLRMVTALSWHDGATTPVAMVEDVARHDFGRQTPGWYVGTVTDDGNRNPVFTLTYQIPALKGGGDDIVFTANEAAEGKFVKHSVWLEEGRTLHPQIGDSRGNDIKIAGTGLYDVTIYEKDGLPMLDLRGPITVNMPLSAADFENGRKHYFIVGQRMGAWRLQPEWELTDAGDGTYTLPQRLLYNGYVMVGCVDNYDDYIAQTYRGYSHTDTGAKSVLDPRNNDRDKNVTFALALLPSTGKNGCADGKYTDTRYNDIERTSPAAQHGGFDAMAMRLINVLDPEGYGDQAHLQSMPSRVNVIRLHVDGNGEPQELTFEGVNTSAIEVAKIRTFSLCGGGIANRNVTYDDATSTTPLNHQPGYGGDNWSEAWIQYDAKGKPYVDAHGEYIYQDELTMNWLGAHPSYFNFGDWFEYTSNNITFTYSPELTHHDQFGRHDDEVLYTYSNNPDASYPGNNSAADHSLDDMLTIPAADRACFVVNDMWMEGMFKIWSGWGGSATNHEYEENGTNYTRWYRSNAGHGAWREDRTAFFSAARTVAFTLFEDIDAANFGIGYGTPGSAKVNADGSIKEEHKLSPERKFFKRVEIWFNLRDGFAYKGGNASVMLFYQEPGGPQIYIEKSGDNNVRYSCSMVLSNDMNPDAEQSDFGNVVEYWIHRIAIDANGNEGEPELVKNERVDIPRAAFADSYSRVLDPRQLAPGRYRYQVSTRRANTGDKVLTAKSNIVRIDGDGTWTGVESVGLEAGEGFEMQVYPNPVDNDLNINANGEIGDLTIWSANGSQVRKLDVSGTAATVNVSSLPAGIYIVNANNTSVRFIKR